MNPLPTNNRQVSINRFRDQEKSFIPAITRILRKNAHHVLTIQEATDTEDMTECFDAVIKTETKKIAIRIRSYYYFKNFRDFTIRAKLKSGRRTELHKIKEGKGDLYFYAWKKEDNNSLIAYMLIDLDKLRESGLLDINKKAYPNNDGHSWLIGFSKDELDVKGNCLLNYERLDCEQESTIERIKSDPDIKEIPRIQQSLLKAGKKYQTPSLNNLSH